jgi:hypothetical protein
MFSNSDPSMRLNTMCGLLRFCAVVLALTDELYPKWSRETSHECTNPLWDFEIERPPIT